MTGSEPRKRGRVFSGWEVRCKLAAVLVWLVGLLFLHRPITLWQASLLILLLIAYDGGMPLKNALKQLWRVSPFILLMLVTLSLSGGLPLQTEAVSFAWLICSRVVTAVLLIVALVGGRDPEDFLRGLAVLPLPPTYLSLMFLVDRYVHMLGRDLRNRKLALNARLFSPRFDLPALRNLGWVTGGEFIRGYDLSERVYDAMRARCYTGVVPYDDPPRPGARDWLKLGLSLLLFACALLAEGVM